MTLCAGIPIDDSWSAIVMTRRNARIFGVSVLSIFSKSAILDVYKRQASDSGNLDFSIKSFYDDVELVNNLIEQKPDWLQEKSTTNDEMRRYLNTRVWLYLNRIFRYSSSGDEEVFVCDMANV